MSASIMFAHGQDLVKVIMSLMFAGAASGLCFFLALGMYLSDKSKKRRLYTIGVVWLLLVVLSFVIGTAAERFME